MVEDILEQTDLDSNLDSDSYPPITFENVDSSALYESVCCSVPPTLPY